MYKHRKSKIIILVLVAFFVVSAMFSIFITLGKKNESNKNISNYELRIIDYNLDFEENSYTINLVSGEIITNVKINNLFVNVNGVGCENLSYTQTLNDEGYYVILISPVPSILNTVFMFDERITADIYIEYDNLSYKVASRDINVSACWSAFV